MRLCMGAEEARQSPAPLRSGEPLDIACGAIGIGEITSIPTAPAIAEAYYQLDGQRRTKLPLVDTPYERRG